VAGGCFASSKNRTPKENGSFLRNVSPLSVCNDRKIAVRVSSHFAAALVDIAAPHRIILLDEI
jgi:hypothetical protein